MMDPTIVYLLMPRLYASHLLVFSRFSLMFLLAFPYGVRSWCIVSLIVGIC